MSEEAATYEASHIEVLEGWEAVRKRPGMYIGSTGERGLWRLVNEIADRGVNEMLAGRAASLDITFLSDGGVRVADDGPGVSVDEVAGTGVSGLEVLLTHMRSGAGPRGRDDVTLGYCGMGPGVVTALSRRVTAEVRRAGVRWVQEYARGVAVTPLTEAGTAADSGTTITFWPDADIFGTAECRFDDVAERFRELAFLNRGLDVSLTDRRRPDDSRSVRFRFPGGARDFVAFLDGHPAAAALPDTVAFECEDPRMAGAMEVALRWSGSREERLRSFANSRPTIEGGAHVAGFRDGVAAAVTAYARAQGLLAASDPDLGADRIGEGLTAVVSVKLDEPEFTGCTRGGLGNSSARACVGQAVREHLGRWLRDHPERAAAVVGLIVRGACRG
ncbi:DNA gyrase subunit B [Streptomyces sp. NPDC054861]